MSASEATDTAAIKAHVSSASQGHEVPTEQDIADRLGRIELLAEQLGRSAEFTDELTAYVADLRAELGSLRNIRIAILFGSTLLGALLLAFAGYVILFRPFLFLIFGTAARVALITSSIAGAVILATIVLKGVFVSIKDRNAEDVLPPSLQALVEAVKAIRPTQ